MRMKNIVLPVCWILLSGCDIEVPGADEKFGKQNFVSAVSLIELHHTRNGEYPSGLSELEYLGDWDSIWLAAVRYEKLDEGYNLYVERGWVGKPQLAFPEGFKKGLGLKKSNVTWLTDKPGGNSHLDDEVAGATTQSESIGTSH